MKKLIISILLVIFVGSLIFAEEWVSFTGKGESAPEYEMINSTSSLVSFELEIPGMKSTDVDAYNRVYIPEHSRMDSVGFPEVPVISYLIAIPECDNVNLNITLLDSVVIDNISIYPAPEWVEVENGDYTYLEEEFSINNSFYNSNEYFPDTLSELVEKGAVRTQHCIRINIYPVHFNPVQQQAIAYSRVIIEMTFDNAIGSVNNDVGIFNEVCGNTFINYISNGLSASVSCGSNRDPEPVQWVETFSDGPDGKYIAESCDYLIVTHSEFWNNPDLQTLADKRREHNGFDVVIVKTIDIEEQVTTPNDWLYEKVKFLIRNTYEQELASSTFDNKLGYVNLFGDVELESGVPYPVPTYQEGYDVYFSQLTETAGVPDVYPDILLGRLPVDNTQQVANVCTKITNYEPINVNVSQGYDNWKERMTFLIGEPSQQEIHDGLEIINPIVTEYTTTLLTDSNNPFSNLNFNTTIFDNSKSSAQTQYANGNLVFTYMGHGGTLCWGCPDTFCYSDIDYSVYNNRLPLIFSIACNTGAFQVEDECMAEDFLVSNSIRGAIGFIGATEEASFCDNYDFAPHLFNAFCSYSLGMCGEILMEAKLKTTRGDARRQYNLIGDPALNILLDSDNIQLCDLLCSPQQIDIEDINHQTLQITAAISNLSHADVTQNVIVECNILNNFTGFSLTSTEEITNGIGQMEYENVIFSFDISSTMPTEFDIQIIVDPIEPNLPNGSIIERNENNNLTSKEYKFLRYQEGFPNLIPISDHNYNFFQDIPLLHNNSILSCGTKSSFDGDLLWNSYLKNEGLYLPIEMNQNDYDYIFRVLSDDEYHLHRIDGNNGVDLFTYSSLNEYRVKNYCLGDINEDGNNELISHYSSIQPYQNWISIYDLDGNALMNPFATTYIKDIAIGDSDLDGINEVFILDSNDLIKYDFQNGALNFNNQTSGGNTLTLSDFNNDGNLDCAIFRNDVVKIRNSADFSPICEIPLPYDYHSHSIGDVDNDGIPEIVLTLYDEVNLSLYIYEIDFLENEYQILFSIDDVECIPNSLILTDLNSDANLDIIFNDANSLLGYSIDGELLFSFPINYDKTHANITDLDSDGDIEIIYGERASSFFDDPKCNIIASDLSLSYGKTGNIYPKMNEFNNNLYSQPYSGQLNPNTNYIWSGSLTLNGEVTLPATSSLIIKSGTIINAKENSKLICNGELIINGTENHPVTFEPVIQGASQNYWQGLEFPEGLTTAELNHVVIQNAEINSFRELNINNGNLINTPLNMDSSSLYLENSILDNSPIYSELYGIMQHSETISIHNCHIFGSLMNAGVETTGYPNINITNNLIENCNSGLRFWESGSGITNSISNNIIRNNQNDGIYLYHSNIDILGNNRIENNNRDGIFIIRDSNFNLIGSEDYPLQIIRENDDHEIRFTYDSRPAQFYYNKIYDENHEYSYVKCERVPVFNEPINISNNNWGTSFNPNTDLSPFELFEYLPIWDPGVPENPDVSADEELYLTAKQSIKSSDYSNAEQTLKLIITIYPASKFARIAAKELFDLKVKSDHDFAGLKLYYATETNMHYDEEMTKLSDYLISCCNVKLEEFQPAIDYHENIIQNPPSTVDSVFAVIDAGYTYLVMENASRANYTGSITELKPNSKKEFEEKRDDLINMLFGNSEPDNEIPEVHKLELYSNYPNPFNPSTTISFSIPEESKVEVSVFNIKGQIVKTLVKDVCESGKHSVIWFGKDNNNKKCSSGIYFYQLKVNGKPKSVKKCLLLK